MTAFLQAANLRKFKIVVKGAQINSRTSTGYGAGSDASRSGLVYLFVQGEV
jgi:phage terminase large subunit